MNQFYTNISGKRSAQRQGIIVSVQTSVKKKNITYRTYNKVYKKIIKKCWKIYDEESIEVLVSAATG